MVAAVGSALMIRAQCAVFSLFVGLCFLFPAPSFAQMLGITDLGSFGGATGYSYAFGINESDYVVGQAWTTGAAHAFIWHNGTMTDLGTLTGDNESAALGINDESDYVGWSMNDSDEDYPILNMTVIPWMWGPGYASGAYDINNNNLVVGDLSFSTPGSIIHAFKYTTSGGTVNLGNPFGPAHSFARSVNDNGDIVGGANASVGGSVQFRSCVWPDVGTPFLLPLGASTSTWSMAMGINSSGQICGTETVPSTGTFAYIYSGSTTTLLPGITLPGATYPYGAANGINDSGVVVGYGGAVAGTGSHAMMWTSTGTAVDLHAAYASTGWQLFSATAINNQGHIVGWGYPPGKTTIHGFILK